MTEKPSTIIKKLRVELRYFQMQTRLDLRNLEASKKKCREIGAKMREAQKAQKRPKTSLDR